MPDNNKILGVILGNAVLLKLGEKVLAIIHARTLRGEFLEGSTAQGYSTKPAGMPYGALAAKIGNGKAAQLLRAIQRPSGSKGSTVGKIGKNWVELSGGDKVYTSKKTGNLWITLSGGYKQLRTLAGRETDRVTLNWSGAMLSALKAKTNVAEPSLQIYFTNDYADRIAGFHKLGAGKNKIRRLFVGLSQAEQDPLEQWLGEEIAKKIDFILPAPNK